MSVGPTLDFFSAGGVAAAAGDFIHLETKVADGTFTHIIFTGIPSTYTHLAFIYMLRSATAATTHGVWVQFNATGLNSYYRQAFFGQGVTTSVNNAFNVSYMYAGEVPAANAPAGLYGIGFVLVPFYTVPNWKRMLISWSGGLWGTIGNVTQAGVSMGYWIYDTVINSVGFYEQATGFWAVGSRVSMYALKT